MCIILTLNYRHKRSVQKYDLKYKMYINLNHQIRFMLIKICTERLKVKVLVHV